MKLAGILIGLMMVGCAQQTPTMSEVKADEPTEVVAYAGMITIYEGDDETAHMEVISKISSFEDKSYAIEESAHIDQDDLENPEFYSSKITIDGETMSIKEKDGKFEGTGEFLEGEPWKRTKWTTKVLTEDDLDLESTMELSGKKLKMTQLLSEGGDEIFNMKGTLEEITLEEYESRIADLK
jgi:hypothetical protein